MKNKITAVIILAALAMTVFASCSGKKTAPETQDGGTSVETTESTAPVDARSAKIELPEGDELPVKATYAHYGCFDYCRYETENEDLIKELMAALRDVEVSDEEGPEITTDDTFIFLTMENGDEYKVVFNGKSLEVNDGKNYPYSLYVVTDGIGRLFGVLDEIAENGVNLDEN